MLNWLVLVMATILLMVLHTWRYRQWAGIRDGGESG